MRRVSRARGIAVGIDHLVGHIIVGIAEHFDAGSHDAHVRLQERLFETGAPAAQRTGLRGGQGAIITLRIVTAVTELQVSAGAGGDLVGERIARDLEIRPEKFIPGAGIAVIEQRRGDEGKRRRADGADKGAVVNHGIIGIIPEPDIVRQAVLHYAVGDHHPGDVVRGVNDVRVVAIGDVGESAVVHGHVADPFIQANGAIIRIGKVQELAMGNFQVAARFEIIRLGINAPTAARAIEQNAVKLEVLRTDEVDNGAARGAENRPVKVRGLQAQEMKRVANIGHRQRAGAVIAAEQIDIDVVVLKLALDRGPKARIQIISGIGRGSAIARAHGRGCRPIIRRGRLARHHCQQNSHRKNELPNFHHISFHFMGRLFKNSASATQRW